MFIFVDIEVNGFSAYFNSMFAFTFIAVDDKSEIVGKGFYKLKEREGKGGSETAMKFWLSDKNIQVYKELHEDPMMPEEAMKQFYEDVRPFMQDQYTFVSDNPVMDILFLNVYMEQFLGIEDFIDEDHYIDVKSIGTYVIGELFKTRFVYSKYIKAMKIKGSNTKATHHPLDDSLKSIILYLPLLESEQGRLAREKRKKKK